MFQNVPEDSRMFRNVPKDYKRFYRSLKNSRKLYNVLKGFIMFQKVRRNNQRENQLNFLQLYYYTQIDCDKMYHSLLNLNLQYINFKS